MAPHIHNIVPISVHVKKLMPKVNSYLPLSSLGIYVKRYIPSVFTFGYLRKGFHLRDAMLARIIVIATYPYVRLSVCLSVTRWYCVKTKKSSGMISSPSGSPKTLVFWRQISSPNSKGSPRTGASNKGRSEKFSDFLAFSVNITKTVADTAKVTISD